VFTQVRERIAERYRAFDVGRLKWPTSTPGPVISARQQASSGNFLAALGRDSGLAIAAAQRWDRH
jgi:hypothetical protein